MYVLSCFFEAPFPSVSTVIYRIQEDGACLYRDYRGLIRTGIEMVLWGILGVKKASKDHFMDRQSAIPPPCGDNFTKGSHFIIT